MEGRLFEESLFVGGTLELFIISALSLIYLSNMTCRRTIA